MKDSFFRMLDRLHNWIYRVVQWGTYTWLIIPRCRNLPKLTAPEKKQLRTYWKKHYGKPIALKEYKWLKTYCGGFADPRYIPEVLWHHTIEPYFTNLQMLPGFLDKNYFDSIIGEKNSPKTLCRCIDHQLLRGNFEAVELETLCKELRSREEVICKPSLDSGGGRGILFLKCDEIIPERIQSLVKQYHGNFIVQEILKQHESTGRFNPNSLNAFRIITMLYHGKVHFLASYLRVGGQNSRVDNLSAGGFFLPVRNGVFTGQVLKENTKTQNVEECEHFCNGVPVTESAVEKWDVIESFITKQHYKLAHFHIIYWDVALSEHGEPIVVEYNLIDSDIYDVQYFVGPIFGEMTEDILKEIRNSGEKE